MCGILIVAAADGRPPAIDQRTFERMRDRMVHRGPDGAGTVAAGAALIGHRRLAVVDPDGGPQPWEEPACSAPDGPLVLTYNGELYEADELRATLPGSWRSRSDTEVLARLLQAEGVRGLDRVRGMFALAAWWPRAGRLLLARDPLGIKPLVWSAVDTPGGTEIVAASETAAVLDHPWQRREPDWVAASAYLTTIRVTMDDRTMYAGIRTVRPGERVTFDLSGTRPRRRHELDPRLDRIWPTQDSPAIPTDLGAAGTEVAEREAADALAAVVRRSVDAHLVADVPVGAMLSGGLDSSLIVREITRLHSDRPRRTGRPAPRLRTWCATGPAELDPESDDAHHAELVASAVGSDHRTITVGRETFRERWPWLVERLGQPLGTPNEIAIHAVAAAARRSVTVLLSGEGADELFAGYGSAVGTILRDAEHARLGGALTTATSRLLDLISWIPIPLKERVLVPPVLQAADHDDPLIAALTERTAAAESAPADPRPLLGALGRLNLGGLLGRLDSSTMLASIEGRTPLADVHVAMAAGDLPVGLLARRTSTAVGVGAGGTAEATLAAADTKRILRRAWAGQLPDAVTRRPKRSFPLPFTDWVSDQTAVLAESATARAVFEPEAVRMVTEDPTGHAMAAWPMINLAMWLRQWD